MPKDNRIRGLRIDHDTGGFDELIFRRTGACTLSFLYAEALSSLARLQEKSPSSALQAAADFHGHLNDRLKTYFVLQQLDELAEVNGLLFRSLDFDQTLFQVRIGVFDVFDPNLGSQQLAD